MDTTTTFVLGIAVGGLIITLVSLFAEMLKIKRQLDESQKSQREMKSLWEKSESHLMEGIRESNDSSFETRKEIMDEIREITSNIQKTIAEINQELSRDIERGKEDTEKSSYGYFNAAMKRIDDMSSYIDRRFDKAIDAMCTRMDTMFVQKETDTTILKK